MNDLPYNLPYNVHSFSIFSDTLTFISNLQRPKHAIIMANPDIYQEFVKGT